MYKINLSTEALSELKTLEKKYQGNWKILRRLRCIKYQHEKTQPIKIKEKIDVSADSITERTKIYIEGGFAVLCDLHYEGRRKSGYEKYKDEIKRMIDENIYNTYIELWDAVEKKFDVGMKKDALYKFAKKKGISATRSVI